MTRASTAAHPQRRRWTIAVALLLLAGGIYALQHVLGNVPWHAVIEDLRATPRQVLLSALALTAGSYCVLTLYDALGLHALGARLRWHDILLTAFPAYAVGHNVGLAALSGGSIRLRWYGRGGLTTMQVTQLIAFGSFTFMLGAALLCGVSLLGRPELAGQVLHIGTTGAAILGVVLVLVVLAYCVLGVLRREPLVILGRRVPLPRLPIALGQVAIASTDLCLAASVLYVLLPDATTQGLLAFLAAYLLAVAAGVASSLPGGIGVFESVLLLLLPEGPTSGKVAALLAYRAIYYLMPLALALVVLAAREAWVGKTALARGLAWMQAWLRVTVPTALGATVFLSGLVLLVSGATPAEAGRLRLLRDVVPLPLLETSHLLSSAAGVGLLLLAQGLQRRLDAAWHVTMILLLLGAAASLAKGLDFEEASLLAGMALLLFATKDRFRRKASLLEQPFSRGWMVAVLAALFSSLCLAWLSYRDVNFSHEMWWHFAFHADAPRALRAAVLTTVLVGLAAAWLLLRPAPHRPDLPDAAELERAKTIAQQSTETSAWLALLGDKNLLFSGDGLGFVMYRPVGRNWIAMGDPVGPPAVRLELMWRFREACDRYAAKPVFYQVGAEELPSYIEAGFVLSKIGEEARVPLGDFGLEGSRRAEHRQTYRRIQRTGVQFEMLDVEQSQQQVEALRTVSDSWLATLAVAEKGFSLGRFDERYLANFCCGVVKREGRIIAFANVWQSAGNTELSIDLMRYEPDAPKGVMDYLMIELMLWGRAQGYAWFNLGMAPLAGLADREFAPLWNRVGAFLFQHGEHFYNFAGLRAYKQKYDPVWRPRYLATTGHLTLPRAVMDVASLIAGGSRRILMR